MGTVSYNLRLTARAEKHLEGIHQDIAVDNVGRADRIILRIAEEASRLSRFPHSGRVGKIKGTRELVIAGTPYLLSYRIRKNTIEVAAIYHGARQWPII